ncbi:uncharacterized protein LOC111695122 [Eurytemora carolleeae]|uniref:uncharacterized protein LOC111695122 n=1 Tax=Eurytemora carolleeae TaxID=1294199 RepID=UPI000C75ED00|nr:uncharacterized protein LOC111695122 [Eurytemora carolleeae]|eukprot:XP_023320092.1 uncharacterized protein LOC111695122 [Eurytemora affinis]
MEEQKTVTAIIIGCGQRGQNYAGFALDFPTRLKVVGVVDPLLHRRRLLGDQHAVSQENQFTDWTQLQTREKFADLVFICTQDKDHCGPAVLMASLGYHIVLEKPMAVTEEDCLKITQACEKNNVMLAVCHVMRYFPPCVKIKEFIDSGKIGQVMTINHTENVGYWHFAHSFVRGNWRNQEESTFSLMAKCCHDMDLIYYWLGSRKATAIQSVGSNQHFKKENKPEGATDTCLTCPLNKTCPYSATRIYLENPVRRWPMSVVCDIEDDPTKYPGALKSALSTSRYGRCVYECDNDVCDSQMVNLMFEGGTVANLTMTAFSKEICARYTRITGSLGEILWQGGENGPITIHCFRSGETEIVYPDLVAPPCKTRGHGGADYFLVDSVIKAVVSSNPEEIKSGAQESLASHLLVFKAEQSRLQHLQSQEN